MTKKARAKRSRIDVIDVVDEMPAAATHLAVMGPIPASAYDDPIKWADAELDKSIPQAVREKQWQLKFGSDAQRDKVASELLARRNVVNKQQAQANPAGVIHLHMEGNPFARRVQVTVDSEAKALPADVTHAHKTEE